MKSSFRTPIIVLIGVVLVLGSILVVAFLQPPAAPSAGPTTPPETTEVPVSEQADSTRTEDPPTATATEEPTSEIGFVRPTNQPGTGQPTGGATFDPTLLLTPFVAPTETPTPIPLANLGNRIELPAIQVYRIAVEGGYLVMAEATNFTDQPLVDVELIFSTPDATPVGDPLPIRLVLLPGESKPGVSDVVPDTSVIMQQWDTLIAHPVGTPATGAEGQAGYPALLTIGTPLVTPGSAGLSYQAQIGNDTGKPATLTSRIIAFYSINGTLVLALFLGDGPQIQPGQIYEISGTVPLSQPLLEGFAVNDITDAILSISAVTAQ